MPLEHRNGSADDGTVLDLLGAGRAREVYRSTAWPRPDDRIDLRDRILAARSVTEALGAWCRERGLGDGEIRVRKSADPRPEPAPDEALTALRPAAGDAVQFRRVHLVCGGNILAEADNWYLSDRLPERANTLLATTDTPFGRILAGPGFRRQTVRACFPGDCQARDDDTSPFDPVLEVDAIVRLDATPVAFVRETFLADALNGAGEE